MSNAELVVAGTFLNHIEAELAQGALEAGGVESIISADDVGAMRPHLSLTGGVRLFVRADDAERAGQILGEAQETPPADGDLIR
jgi:hypothetical protein